MSITYTYPLSNFINGISIEELQNEITNDPKISQLIDYVSINNNNVNIIFLGPLTAGETTELEYIMTNHVGILKPSSSMIVSIGAVNTTYIMLASQSVDRIVNLPDANTNLVGNDTTDILANKTINAVDNNLINISDINIATNAGIQISKLGTGEITNEEFEYLAGIRSGVVGKNDNVLLLNKTLDDTTTLFANTYDRSKKFKFDCTNIPSNTNYTYGVPLNNTTLVGTDTNQTLKNKIIDAGSNIITNVSDTCIVANAGINASKIADGTVSNSNFKFLTGVTSNIQIQLDSKLDNMAGIGDLSGVDIINPTDGDIIQYSNGKWINASINNNIIKTHKFDAYYYTDTAQVVTSDWTDIPLHVERIKDSTYIHSTDDAQVTFSRAGSYLIVTRCSSLVTTGGDNLCKVRLAINTGSGYDAISGSSASLFNRSLFGDEVTVNVSVIITANIGDSIKMQVIKLKGYDTVTIISEETSMTIISL